MLTSGAPEHDWVFLTEADEQTQREAVADCDVLVCSRLSAEVAAVVGASLVQVTGTGLDRVAVQALPVGTEVTTTAHHERSIAEHVLLSVMALERQLLVRDRALRSVTWRTLATDPTVPAFRTLDTLTLGAVGLGGIGAETLRLAAAWGMDNVAIRGNPDAELTAMKPDAFLVNVARGAVVDQAALYAALTEPAGDPRAIGGAAIDVWWSAPAPDRTPPADHDFTALDNVVLTPHCSGHAESTFSGRAADLAANVERLAAGTLRLGVLQRHP